MQLFAAPAVAMPTLASCASAAVVLKQVCGTLEPSKAFDLEACVTSFGVRRRRTSPSPC
jgi:hypothetical protein